MCVCVCLYIVYVYTLYKAWESDMFRNHELVLEIADDFDDSMSLGSPAVAQTSAGVASRLTDSCMHLAAKVTNHSDYVLYMHVSMHMVQYVVVCIYIYIHCITLHCIALRCVALHCVALHCIALRCIALHCIALRCITLHCIALRCIALHCITLHIYIYILVIIYAPTSLPPGEL